MHARSSSPNRPPTGFGHYLRDSVYGALDGVITTLAVIAGTAGAALDPRVGVILGLANLVADGLSMGASNYLGLKSELEQTRGSIEEEAPWRHGLATIAAFVGAGCLPLLGYVLGNLVNIPPLAAAAGIAFLALFGAGAVRAPFVNKTVVASAAEMLLVGAAAAGAAYGIGALAERFVLGPS